MNFNTTILKTRLYTFDDPLAATTVWGYTDFCSANKNRVRGNPYVLPETRCILPEIVFLWCAYSPHISRLLWGLRGQKRCS